MLVALFATLHRPHAVEIVRQTIHWLLENGHVVRISQRLAAESGCPECAMPEGEEVVGADLAIAIGGDGTMLGAVRLAAPHQVPVLGVNAGALGFLTELTPDELFENLPHVVNGEYALESRLMLRARIFRDGQVIDEEIALNDIVVRQGTKGRLVTLDVMVAGHQLGHFAADGLIVATPTGSTAYGLSAGGPIVHPTSAVSVLVPICPHSLSFRPLVIPYTDSVEIICEGNQHGDEMQVMADGQDPIQVMTGDRVLVEHSAEQARLVKLGVCSFYDRLREKLQWGSGGTAGTHNHSICPE